MKYTDPICEKTPKFERDPCDGIITTRDNVRGSKENRIGEKLGHSNI